MRNRYSNTFFNFYIISQKKPIVKQKKCPPLTQNSGISPFIHFLDLSNKLKVYISFCGFCGVFFSTLFSKCNLPGFRFPCRQNPVFLVIIFSLLPLTKSIFHDSKSHLPIKTKVFFSAETNSLLCSCAFCTIFGFDFLHFREVVKRLQNFQLSYIFSCI